MLDRTKCHLIALLLFASAPALVDVQEVPEKGYRAEYLQQASVMSERIISLASAIPEEKYTWRPGEGVRSVGEVLMHVTDMNYNFPRFLGIPSPEGNAHGHGDHTSTSKEDIIRELEASFEYLRTAVLNTSDADQDKETVLFGNNKSTYRGALLLSTRQTAEHLGQLIAYARMNDVVPPWSQH